MRDQEIEAKFYVNDLKRVESRLRELGATLVEPRLHEHNLRFDLPDHSLSMGFRALRLRQAGETRMTYKGPPADRGGLKVRSEFEFTVGDFDAARKFLEALGYVVVAVYEKYRATYALDGTHIMLDELPYGTFVEIEGTDDATIRSVTSRLGLAWEAAIPIGYLTLFESFSAEQRLDPSQLTFAALRHLTPSPETLHVRAADL